MPFNRAEKIWQDTPGEVRCNVTEVEEFGEMNVGKNMSPLPVDHHLMLSALSEWFWQERLWFPEGLGWADLEDRDGRVYAKARDLWVALPIALIFLIVRQIFERAVATPLASLLGKPWLYDLKEMWEGFPVLTVLPSQYWYYMIELGFYSSLLFSVASDVKRKDFKEQIVHHVATILLISFSWCVNYIRAGTLIMLVHDSSDYFLESAKMFNYAGWRNACNYIFIMFAAIFIVTRLIIFPFRIIYCTWVYPVTIYEPFFGYYFFNGLLMVLQCLHIFWAVLIIRIAVRFLTNNEKVDDERSDKDETDESEDEEEEEEEEEKGGKKDMKKNGPVQNGHTVHNNNHSKTE
ncbi:Ceramide synthase 2 [Larimichthys crocea]|uniref:Uncharacterized protein n=1 Tax=Larimichthys crocea TaxID=215358 RepID=A0ACD3QTH3_LARCR|nr:Ceramide synthase 2 [Larimichthys crocea]